MKKFMLLAMMVLLTSTVANADVVYKYNNAGAISNPTPVRFGQNAAFTPENQARTLQRHRQMKHEDQYYNGLEKGYATNININGSFNSGSGQKVKKQKAKTRSEKRRELEQQKKLEQNK